MSGDTASFRWCRAGPKGGGYNIRAFVISCRRVAAILPGLFISPTTRRVAQHAERDPDSGNRRLWENVYRNKAGWTCLAQSMPRLYVTQFLCVRGKQVILFRFT